MEHILKHFPELTPRQQEQFEAMIPAYREWNEKINVVSRKDIDNLEVNHILHSLAIAKLIKFSPGTQVIDLGTGGGFPAIPLAVLFPDTHFLLVDRTQKKLRVAEAVAQACGIENVSFFHGDFAECKEKVDFVVSRAVMPQKDLIKMVGKNISCDNRNALPNGLITLKGGNLGGELQGIKKPMETVEIKDYFDEPFFETKKIIYTQI